MWTLPNELSMRIKRETLQRLRSMGPEDNDEVAPGLCVDRCCLTMLLSHELTSALHPWDVHLVPGDGSGPFPDELREIQAGLAQVQSLFDPDTRQINPDAVLECNMTVRRFARAYILHHHLKRRAKVT